MKGIFPCPCCGYLSIGAPPGSYQICKVCGWEDDGSQLSFPLEGGGANEMCLLEAQIEFRAKQYLGKISVDETYSKDKAWRPLDPKSDLIYSSNYILNNEDKMPQEYFNTNYWDVNKKVQIK